MNQLTVALVILSALCYIHVNSLPLEDPAEFLTDEDVHHEEHIRVRRFTCDVLSAEAKGIKLNHAACGAHCLFRGRTGGYCNSKRVCICR